MKIRRSQALTTILWMNNSDLKRIRPRQGTHAAVKMAVATPEEFIK